MSLVSLSCGSEDSNFVGTIPPLGEGDLLPEEPPNDDKARREVSSDDVADYCNTLPIMTVREFLSFPATNGCEYNKNGNLGRRNMHLQAIGVQEDWMSLPADNLVICNLSMNTQSQSLQYDDLLIMTLEDDIILSSNKDFFDELEVNKGIYRWDFERVKGIPVKFFNVDPYCLGSSGHLCNLPETDEVGTMELDYQPEDFKEISARLVGKKSLKVNLIATGDNDNSDCMHSDFSLTYRIDYVNLGDVISE